MIFWIILKYYFYLYNIMNIVIREIQTEIHEYYAADAAKYDSQNKLKI